MLCVMWVYTEARAASLRELVEAREEMQGMREEGDSLRHQLDRVIHQGVHARVEARQVAESEATALRQLAAMKTRLECGQRQLAEMVESHEKQLAETLRSAKESDIHHGGGLLLYVFADVWVNGFATAHQTVFI